MIDVYSYQAIEADRCKRYLDAVDLYEKAIVFEKASSEVYINLSFLYWILGSKCSVKHLPAIANDRAISCSDQYRQVLSKGITCFPGNIEMIFWSRYFPQALCRDRFAPEEAVRLVKQSNNNSLVPYFFLYLSDQRKYKVERDLLLIECRATPTAKNLHIISLIEN